MTRITKLVLQGFKSFAKRTEVLFDDKFNVVLGPMAVLVHGVRLNVLEFCGHVDVKWSGFSYRPLKK